MMSEKARIKMVVTDLDGTLLRADKTISCYTRSVLQRCRDVGIYTAYATGRTRSSIDFLPIGLFDAQITTNGAIAKAGETTLYKRLVPYESARPVLMACDAYGLKTASEISGMHYSNFDVAQEWLPPRRFELTDFSQHSIDAEKLYAIVRFPEDATFIKRLLPNDLYLLVSRDGFAMMMHREATKAKAVAALARFWGIDSSEIAAFGDDTNDLDMLKACGYSIAVDDAIPEVKAIANFICESGENDGVARWIEKNVLSSAKIPV